MGKEIITLIAVGVLIAIVIIVMKKREKQDSPPSEFEEKKEKQEQPIIDHSSPLGLLLNILGAISLTVGIVVIVTSLIEYGIIFILSALLLFAVAELVYNSQFQTKILLNIYVQNNEKTNK